MGEYFERVKMLVDNTIEKIKDIISELNYLNNKFGFHMLVFKWIK